MATALRYTSENSVIGFFSTGEQAHQAVHALIDAGFLPTEIGAALHTRGNTPSGGQPLVGGSLREDISTTRPGAAGHTTEQPVVTATGSGTRFGGAGNPAPIPGSELTHTGLPSELKSEMPHDPGMAHDGDTGGAPARMMSPEFGSPKTSHPQSGSWSSKIAHLFHSKNETRGSALSKEEDNRLNAEGKQLVDKESQKFGTGEGHLITPGHTRRYSDSAFHTSLTGRGVSETHARSLSQRLNGGGAVVTVQGSARNSEAELILESNGGDVHLSTDTHANNTTGEDSDFEVFGILDNEPYATTR